MKRDKHEIVSEVIFEEPSSCEDSLMINEVPWAGRPHAQNRIFYLLSSLYRIHYKEKHENSFRTFVPTLDAAGPSLLDQLLGGANTRTGHNSGSEGPQICIAWTVYVWGKEDKQIHSLFGIAKLWRVTSFTQIINIGRHEKLCAGKWQHGAGDWKRGAGVKQQAGRVRQLGLDWEGCDQ